MKKRVDSKDAAFLSPQNEIKFNGAIIRHDGTNITISHPQHIEKLKSFNTFHFTKELFLTQRVQGAYIIAVCRPDRTYAFSKLSQSTAPNEKD